MPELQYLKDPRPAKYEDCGFRPGQKFQVAKIDPLDLHSAWYVVMPGGAMLTFNNCAYDAMDEAAANWVAGVLNAAIPRGSSRAEAEAYNAFVQGVKPTMKGRWAQLQQPDQARVLALVANFHCRDGTKNPESPMGTISITPGQLNDLLAYAMALGLKAEPVAQYQYRYVHENGYHSSWQNCTEVEYREHFSVVKGCEARTLYIKE